MTLTITPLAVAITFWFRLEMPGAAPVNPSLHFAPMKQITAALMILPPVFMGLAMVFEDAAAFFAIIWLVCAIACLAWGIRWLRTRHRLAWVCIGYALLQFALLSLPFFLPARVSHG